MTTDYLYCGEGLFLKLLMLVVGVWGGGWSTSGAIVH